MLLKISFVSRPVSNADYPALEKVSDLAIKEKQKFERLVVPKETLLEMFPEAKTDPFPKSDQILRKRLIHLLLSAHVLFTKRYPASCHFNRS